MGKELTTGVVFGVCGVEWTSLEKRGDFWSVVSSGRAELTQSVYSGGKEAFAEALDELKGERARFKAGVTLSLSADYSLLRALRLPVASDEELDSMVQLQVDRFSPFPAESSVVSFEVLSRDDSGVLVLACVARKEPVDALSEFAAYAGFKIERLDSSVLGWWRGVQESGLATESGRRVHVAILDGSLQVIVADSGLPVLFRSLGSGDWLGETGAAELGREVGLTLMSAELEFGVSDGPIVVLWGLKSESGDEGVASKAIGVECGCEVQARSVGTLPCVSEGIARRAVEAQQERRLDVVPRERREAERLRRHGRRVWGAAGALVLLWGFVVGGFFGGLYYQQKKLSYLQGEVERWRVPAMEVRAMRRRLSDINRYRDRGQSVLECMREICLAQPQGVDLLSFSYRKGESVKVAGEALSVNLVYDFKNKLDTSGLFAGVGLDGPRRDARKRCEVFELDLKLPNSGVAR